MRCDLHVHTRYSGVTDAAPGLAWLESYSEPEAVFEAARRRGMDLVTITDHDSIEGALALVRDPRVFVSEEVTLTLPTGRCLHLGVYGIDEEAHERIAALRADAEALVAFLAQRRIPFGVNHVFSPLTGSRRVEDIEWALRAAPLVESFNAMLPRSSNRFAALAGKRAGLGAVGGSDAHALPSVARAWTRVRGASNREEFLDGLRAGRCEAEGTRSNLLRLTRDVLSIAGAGAVSHLRTARGAREAVVALAVLAAAPAWTPVVTAATAWSRLREHALSRAFFLDLSRRPAWSGSMRSQPAFARPASEASL